MGNMGIIRRMHYVDTDGYPVIYVLGPGEGGEDWPADAVRQLQKAVHPDRKFFVVVPCEWDDQHPLAEHFCKSSGEKQFDCLDEWEEFYQQKAADSTELRREHSSGCFLIWLPRESKIHPRSDGNPYAMYTGFAMGELVALCSLHRVAHLVVGGEKGFHGLETIRRKIHYRIHAGYPFYSTLEETVAAAVKAVFKGCASKSLKEEEMDKRVQEQFAHLHNEAHDRRVMRPPAWEKDPFFAKPYERDERIVSGSPVPDHIQLIADGAL